MNTVENESVGTAQLLEGVDPDDIKALFATGHEVFYTPGELIFDVGDEGEGRAAERPLRLVGAF